MAKPGNAQASQKFTVHSRIRREPVSTEPACSTSGVAGREAGPASMETQGRYTWCMWQARQGGLIPGDSADRLCTQADFITTASDTKEASRPQIRPKDPSAPAQTSSLGAQRLYLQSRSSAGWYLCRHLGHAGTAQRGPGDNGC